MDRTIEALLSLTNQRMAWDQVKDNLGATATFRAEPSSLKVAGVFPGTVIWAIDTANNQLVAMLDSLTEDKPLTGQPRPAPGIEAAVIPLAGNGFNIPFTIRWTASSPLIYADVPIRFEAQVALDPNFAGMVIPPVFVAGSASEGVWLVPTNTLMAGVKYYFRVRVVGTTAGNDIHSPWSDTLILAASPGVAVAQRYIGPNALTPPGGAAGVPADNVTFTWSVVPGTNKYAFWLASDAAMQKALAAVVTSLPAYTWDKKLDYNTTYYWQVQAVQPAVGDKSAVFVFNTVGSAPVPKVSTFVNPPGFSDPPEGYQWGPPPSIDVFVSAKQDTNLPNWAWVVVAFSGLAILTVIILMVRYRRRY
jgi:hypothetical protein